MSDRCNECCDLMTNWNRSNCRRPQNTSHQQQWQLCVYRRATWFVLPWNCRSKGKRPWCACFRFSKRPVLRDRPLADSVSKFPTSLYGSTKDIIRMRNTEWVRRGSARQKWRKVRERAKKLKRMTLISICYEQNLLYKFTGNYVWNYSYILFAWTQQVTRYVRINVIYTTGMYNK